MWIDNDQGGQEYWLDQARQALKQAPNDDFVKRGVTQAQDAARRALAAQLKDEIEEEAPDLGASMFADLLGAALSSVQWHEIAAALLEDMEEVDPEGDDDQDEEEE